MRREEDARCTGKVRLKSGHSKAHACEEQRGGRVEQHVADVEPERLQTRHLVVGSAKIEKYYRISILLIFTSDFLDH
jgi:hypothetical protein